MHEKVTIGSAELWCADCRDVLPELRAQLAARRKLHDVDLAKGMADVELPHALAAKYPRAGTATSTQTTSCSAVIAAWTLASSAIALAGRA